MKVRKYPPEVFAMWCVVAALFVLGVIVFVLTVPG